MNRFLVIVKDENLTYLTSQVKYFEELKQLSEEMVARMLPKSRERRARSSKAEATIMGHYTVQGEFNVDCLKRWATQGGVKFYTLRVSANDLRRFGYLDKVSKSVYRFVKPFKAGQTAIGKDEVEVVKSQPRDTSRGTVRDTIMDHYEFGKQFSLLDAIHWAVEKNFSAASPSGALSTLRKQGYVRQPSTDIYEFAKPLKNQQKPAK